ncbi:ATP-binding protein [Streptomyces sp. NBC_00846]|uniref:ATP-binding protein n=1 Tax=Streptomyces sp. NBC_00846 TaxID=2975849 RepID=UPI003865B92A|nr:ATP-binding protein [Streptomyces sp. NBC_00846]
MTLNRRRVTVAVADDDPTVPAVLGVLPAGPEGEHGRGLVLVDSLALAWGANIFGGRSPSRKVVWFTLGRPESTP